MMRILSDIFTFIGLFLLSADLTLSFGLPDGSQKALVQPDPKSLISTVRGVNLGGWLVLDVAAELTLFTTTSN